MIEVKIGQVWKLIDAKKYYSIGFKGDYFIVLSLKKDEFKIGCFWWSGETKDWGGAREHYVYEKEINEIGMLVGYLPELVHGGKDEN